jgi:hypothetical protein
MDLVTGAIVLVGLREAGRPSAELVADFLKRVLAPSADALGEALAHPIVEWQKRRVMRATAVVERAARLVSEAGAEPHAVPGRVLLPLLERSSLEEDKELQARWAALLANAAIRPESVPPAFVTLLSELSPVDARILNRLYADLANYANVHNRKIESLQGLGVGIGTYTRNIIRHLRLRGAAVAVSAGNLQRLGVAVAHEGTRAPTKPWIPSSLTVTPYGVAFIRACVGVGDGRQSSD